MEKRFDELLDQMMQIYTALFNRTDKRELTEKILESAIQLTGSDRGTIFLVPKGKRHQQLKSFVATGLKDQHIEVEVEKGLAGRVFKTAIPMRLDDAQASPLFFPGVDKATGYETKSLVAVPLRTPKGEVIGVIELLNSRLGRFSETDLKILQVFSLFATIAIDHDEEVHDLKEARDKFWQLSQWQNDRARDFLQDSTNPKMQEILSRLEAYAESDSPALIEGESGTGKEVITQLLHLKSRRREGPFVPVNCAAIPESLFEAELFGVAKGAATGTSARRGKIELAAGGTLFLDEIGELPLYAQAKLLRVLQDRSVQRVGSEESPVEVDFRLICATNIDLQKAVADGRFREDLLYRLNVIRLAVPPLRERVEDIPELTRNILAQLLRKRSSFRQKTISPQALRKLMSYSWPGNIRQLQNKLEGALIFSGSSPTIEPHHLELEQGPAAAIPSTTSESDWIRSLPLDFREAKAHVENLLIARALRECDGNKTEAAEKLGLTREGLRKAMKKAA